MRDDLIVQRRLTLAVWKNRVRHGSSWNGFVEIAASLFPFYLKTVAPVNRNPVCHSNRGAGTHFWSFLTRDLCGE
jgi:hypothetical protein